MTAKESIPPPKSGGITRMDVMRAKHLCSPRMPTVYDEVRSRLAKDYLSEDNIRRAAYMEWECDGRPDGNTPCPFTGMPLHKMHWLRATMILELLVDTDAATLSSQ